MYTSLKHVTNVKAKHVTNVKAKHVTNVKAKHVTNVKASRVIITQYIHLWNMLRTLSYFTNVKLFSNAYL